MHTEYTKQRDKHISDAVAYANREAGINHIAAGKNKKRWGDEWNRAFHFRMDDLMKGGSNVLHR